MMYGDSRLGRIRDNQAVRKALREGMWTAYDEVARGSKSVSA